LSARKIRSRFQTLVAQACDKCSYRESVKMIADTTEVKLRISERYVVQITPAFKCSGVWPRSAAAWPKTNIPWPHPQLVVEVNNKDSTFSPKKLTPCRGNNQRWKETPGSFPLQTPRIAFSAAVVVKSVSVSSKRSEIDIWTFQEIQ